MEITDEQRAKIRKVRLNQAVEYLKQIEVKQNGLINGNFTAVAHRYGFKVKELRSAYEESK